MEPKYLGDGVYLSFENGVVRITTGHHNPNEAQNVVFLEPETLIKLMTALNDLATEIKNS